MIPRENFDTFLDTHDGHGRISCATRRFLHEYFNDEMVNKIMKEFVRLEEAGRSPYRKWNYFDDTTYGEFEAIVRKCND